MKKHWVMLVIVSLSLLLGGCASAEPYNFSPVTEITTTPPTEVLFPAPSTTMPAVNMTLEPTIYQTGIPVTWNGGDSIKVSAEVIISKAHAGAVVDTWTQDKVCDDGWKYYAGNPVSFNIYNGTDTTKDFDIGVEMGGQNQAFAQWVNLSSNHVTIPPHMMLEVPFSIMIPQQVSVKIPKQWEFRFNVIPTTSSNVFYNTQVRVVVNMQ